ncbi:TonB-dependent receptor plug domain-containing protein [Brenneria tiliae]|uniref:TonB-dependent receptor plug domain-containing protein n=1 Tax=Brenneria tiliae TaxID=2914984 RepID=UPI002014B6CB|nr:TonB-dependent receptor plug domain-containing protein [Brenneria tiliae]MCL2896316.1 TonB-dependent receptor plug domain-containing protein [Brenneria tiliae]MCL2900916.1 TonB-dependent receptor plug domain-containing protein [Brenneria tiliae]
MEKNVYLVMLLALLTGPAFAQQNDTSTNNNQQKADVETEDDSLDDASEDEGEDTILVRSTPTSQSMGTQIINAEQIRRTPTRNGSITELLKSNPNVQFANSADNGSTPGEISPENVSFHGEKFYQNNYMIDGLSNNNTINPGANGGELSASPDGYSPTDLPAGGTQSFWINSELIEQLEVFDSNVSAKYGDFSGGVVDAKLKDPKLDKASGKVSYRTTRDSWTRYHVDEDIREDFDTATNLYYQPKFTKNFYSVTVNQPLSDKAGFIFAYNRQESTIPYYHANLAEWTDQKRIAETYLLKGTYLADNGDIFRLTGMYAPHESRYYKKDIKDGAFTNTGGGYRFNMEWEHNADWGKVSSLAGYQHEQNKIDHGTDSYAQWYSYYRGETSNVIYWTTSSASANAHTAQLGGYGEFATRKDTITLKQDYELNPLALYGTQHQFDLGWQVDFYSAQYRRYRDAYASRGAITWDTSVVCQSGDDYCIDGEQYYKNRTVYPARTVEGDYTNYAVYLQDSITFDRLEVTPGVRLSYDDYLGNLNIAPRFSTSYDVFGDRSTRVFGGANRYYAQNMLAYMLRNGISSYNTQTRTDASSAWTNSDLRTATYDYDISDLKTPFSDELSLGLSQRMWDTIWTAKWVHRKGRDQFGRSNYTDESGQRYYVLTNDANTQGNTFSLTVEPISPYHFAWADVNWRLGANISNNNSSSQSYYDVSDTNSSMVIFDGNLMERGDMDALDYNTPWRAFLNVDTHFPAMRLTWGQTLGYTSGYKGYTTSSVLCPSGNGACGDYEGSATLYTEKQYKNYISYDWRFAYSQPVYRDQALDITLDVLNVFDNVIETSSSGTTASSTITYKTGRQFWLGVAYTW